jgi:hypothetical protein
MRGQTRIKKGNPIYLLFRHLESFEKASLHYPHIFTLPATRE